MNLIIILITIFNQSLASTDAFKMNQSGIEANNISLSGIAMDSITKQPLVFSSIALYLDSTFIAGAETDLDGNYHLSVDSFGIYSLESSYVGYKRKRITSIDLNANGHYILDIEMTEGIEMDENTVITVCEKLIVFENTAIGETVTAEAIKKLSTRDLSTIETAPKKRAKLKYIIKGYWQKIWN